MEGPSTPAVEAPLLNGNGTGPNTILQSPVEDVGADGEFNALRATLGGVDPVLVAPLTVAPNIEKVSQLT